MLIYNDVRECNNETYTFTQAIMPSIRKVLKGNIKYVHKDEMVNFCTHVYNLIIWVKDSGSQMGNIL